MAEAKAVIGGKFAELGTGIGLMKEYVGLTSKCCCGTLDTDYAKNLGP